MDAISDLTKAERAMSQRSVSANKIYAWQRDIRRLGNYRAKLGPSRRFHVDPDTTTFRATARVRPTSCGRARPDQTSAVA
jgi:hypothetical protein